ncbi:MAG: ATP-binding protein [Candidatus Aminicenantes bacterium]|jgi:signal transduction histidine kinase
MTKRDYSLNDFLTLTHRIMHLAFQGLLRVDFLREASQILVEFAECDSVEMWLKERGKFYRCEVSRSLEESFQFEIIPTERDEEGRAIPALRIDSDIDRVCRDVFLGKIDPALSTFASDGSFWTGNVENSLVFLLGQKGSDSSEKSPEPVDYASLAIIPIAVEDQNIGLLQLKSAFEDFFTKEDVEFYKAVVQSLGIALIHRRAQVELRERVKELKCLYEIAKIAERPEISLGEILQGIVKLIPPAWLYPDIASARIVLDDQLYQTYPFKESDQMQSAKIIVEDKARGKVEVFYSAEKPELDEGPFLKEERVLIEAIARDISLIITRKQADEEKLKLQEQLRHADRLATIGQLSAGVAHELNEPIGSVLGYSQLIYKHPDLPAQIKQDAEKIMKASLHAREVVKKLMLFARQTPPKKIQVNLNKVVEEGLYILESRCAKEGIKVVRALSRNLPEVTADPAQLTQVLVNLVVNSIQAMPKGGELSIQTRASNAFVQLIIKDSGVGMSENVQKKIFLPFYTTKDVGRGTGLGLAVVHGIVTSHEGSIHVTSKEGRGTTFKIQFPIKAQAASGTGG